MTAPMLFRRFLKGAAMRSLEEHCKAAKEKAKQQQRKRRMEVRKTARREQAINDGRCFEIGRIVCERFPELRKYQPKYGDATSDKIHVIELNSCG
mgnify:FL=1